MRGTISFLIMGFRTAYVGFLKADPTPQQYTKNGNNSDPCVLIGLLNL